MSIASYNCKFRAIELTLQSIIRVIADIPFTYYTFLKNQQPNKYGNTSQPKAYI